MLKPVLRTRPNDALFAAMIAGFALLCFANVACFFPHSLMDNSSSPDAFRSYNLALGISSVCVAIAYGVGTLKAPRRIFYPGALVGYGILLVGLGCMMSVGGADPLHHAAFAGVLCGAGLACTMVFWFGLLTFLPERRAMFAQGWQALLGGALFAVMSLSSLVALRIAVVLSVVLSCGCALFAWRRAKGNRGETLLWGAVERQNERTSGVRDSAHLLLLPVVGFTIVSFLYGALTAVAMAPAPAGSSSAYLVTIWGSPVGATAFLLWARFSGRRSYEVALQAMFGLLALVLVLAPFDVVMFALALGYQVCGLLFYSLIVDEFSNRRRLAVGTIAVGYALVHGAFLVGLFVPRCFGVTSYEAFAHSTPLMVFLVYAVFGVLLLVVQYRKQRELHRLEDELYRQREEQEGLRRAVADTFDEESSAVCEKLGRTYGLTKRETEVLCLLARGRDVAFVCNELYLARNTVKGYTKRIYAKLGIHSKQELIDCVEQARKSFHDGGN